MHLLALNCGSSSIKADVITPENGKRLLQMRVSRVKEAQPLLWFSDAEALTPCPVSGHEAVLEYALTALKEKTVQLALGGIVHRVVHGGSRFAEATLINPAVEAAIAELAPLAPLHNPVNLLGIQAARQIWPEPPHVAVFDTAFHATLPRRAKTYALPRELCERHGLRRYGFHGTSHRFVAGRAAQYLGFPLRELRILSCHLGSGASVCAIEYGRSVETSMGMTPLEGLVMGTRPGDLDPGILLRLMREEGWDADRLDQLLNQQSGLLGLAGDNDMRDLQELAANGDEGARMAIQVFAHRLRKYIGAYAAVMGGADAIVFTGGIGENSAVIRERVAQRLGFLGARLDEEANRDARLENSRPVIDISTPNSRCKLLVVATDEQYEMARQAAFVIRQHFAVKHPPRQIPVAISARHVHLRQETIEKLFGKGHQLSVHKWLSQPGQFAAKERLTLVGPKDQIEGVRVLGPPRQVDQVEISRTDEFFLGIDAPVRASGQVENTPGIRLVGPAGSVELPQGVICAWRHIHMTPEDAEAFGVQDRDIVEVRINTPERSLTFGNVLIRVKPTYKLEMHIDTDEANAAELSPGAKGVLIPTESTGSLLRKVQT
ncbi:MAG: acetate/propionate family kinase [Bacteroidetes bacterium]|nr:MAG: acetate/propionate family kinase [Bacteroidota bacterium]